MTWYTLIYCRPPADRTFGKIWNLIIIIIMIVVVTVKIIFSISMMVLYCGHQDNNQCNDEDDDALERRMTEGGRLSVSSANCDTAHIAGHAIPHYTLLAIPRYTQTIPHYKQTIPHYTQTIPHYTLLQ